MQQQIMWVAILITISRETRLDFITDSWNMPNKRRLSVSTVGGIPEKRSLFLTAPIKESATRDW
jgi:hypothetical protein